MPQDYYNLIKKHASEFFEEGRISIIYLDYDAVLINDARDKEVFAWRRSTQICETFVSGAWIDYLDELYYLTLTYPL